MSQQPVYSIVIPAYNRRVELERLINALHAQSAARESFEIIVLDDGSTDGTVEFLAGLSGQVRWKTSDRSGPGTARNQGAELARGSIVVFIDTDCVPEPEWLMNLTQPLADEKIGATGGAEKLISGGNIFERAISYVMFSKLSTGGLRGGSGKRLARYYPRTFNMAVRKEVYDSLHGFRPMYNGEDVEFSYRVREAGYELEYCDGARVEHLRRFTLADFIRRIFIMGRTRVTLFRLHRSLLEPLHLMPAAAILVLWLMGLFMPILYGLRLFWIFILLVLLLYAASLGLSGYKVMKHPAAFLLAPLLTAIQILSYGAGFWIGITDPGPRDSQ